jgi:superfamily II DNA/RNA helicase
LFETLIENFQVEHVISYDMSITPIGYLHRVGRTARLGARGKATSFVTHLDRGMAAAIEKMDAEGKPVEGVSSSFHRMQKHKKLMEKSNKKDWGEILNAYPPGFFDGQ